MAVWNERRNNNTSIHNVLFFLLLLVANLQESWAWVSKSSFESTTSTCYRHHHRHHRHHYRYRHHHHHHHQQQRILGRLLSSPASSAQQQQDDTPHVDFTIRACEYGELAAVADIMMDAFHTEKTASLRLYELADLERSFPYVEPDMHQMLVAVVDVVDDDDERIAGFVDVDARPCPTNDSIQLPRPRLSNLAVQPEFQRRGIAAALVQECERFVEQIGPVIPGQRQGAGAGAELWIRVEETNEAAVAMYTKNLDYEITASSDDGMMLTLHKSLA